MKNFLINFWADYSGMAELPEDVRQAGTKRWMDWVLNLDAQGNLADRGNRLHSTGKVVSADGVVTDGPYAEVKEFIGGHSVIKAETYEDAVALVKDCPVFQMNGKVEIREINPM